MCVFFWGLLWSHRPQSWHPIIPNLEISLMDIYGSMLQFIFGWMTFWAFDIGRFTPPRRIEIRRTRRMLSWPMPWNVGVWFAPLHKCIGWNKLLTHPPLHFQTPVIDEDITRANSRLELSIPADTCSRGTVERVELLVRKYCLRTCSSQALFKDSGISFDSATDCEKYELKVEQGLPVKPRCLMWLLRLLQFRRCK